MTTLGDILAIVASVLGAGASAWALMVAMRLLFPGRVEVAASTVLASPGRTILRGVLVTLVIATVGIILSNMPDPVSKIVGVAVLLAGILLSIMGASGVAEIAGDRIRESVAEMPGYAAFLRGAGFLVGASMLPLIGWLLVGPLLFLAGMGAGWRALRTAKTPKVELVPEPELGN